MKKGFTMIELIFVIVILGILAAVAIPKLNATRDDAEIAKAATNVSTIMGDFASYYTSKGKLESLANVKQMTNVALDNGNLKIKGKNCLTFAIADSAVTVTATNEDSEAVCAKLLTSESVKAILTGKKGGNGTDKDTAVTIDKKGAAATFDFAASGITW